MFDKFEAHHRSALMGLFITVTASRYGCALAKGPACGRPAMRRLRDHHDCRHASDTGMLYDACLLEGATMRACHVSRLRLIRNHPFYAKCQLERFPIAAVPVISSYVLQGLPTFIRDEIGGRALQRANHAAGFDAELIEDRNCYVSQRSVLNFLDAITRSAGVHDLGLLLVPAMNVAEYGTFGRYICEAESLGLAIKRSMEALRYHSTFDSLVLTTSGDEARLSYEFALAGAQGYRPVASAAAGELISLFNAYLPDNWRPIRIELNIPTPRRSSLFEDVFQCPVIFNAPAVTLVTERRRIMTASKCLSRSILTIEDVARDRAGGAPQGLLDVAFAQIRAQLPAGNVSIEEVARSMETSVRTLQRELNRAGTDFRSLTSSVRIERATELLHDRSISITCISEDLGYSSPAGFSRAFRKATGLGPREFRNRELTGLSFDSSKIEHDAA